MTKRKPSYPQDEFDLAPDAIRRSGVHRGTKSWWSQVWPYLLALVLAAAVGFGTIQYLMQSPGSKVNEYINEASNTDGASDASDEATEDATDDATGAATDDATDKATDGSADATDDASSTDDASDDASDEPTDTETTDSASASVDHSISIRVLNAGGVSGAAATAANKIAADGFTAVEAANFEGTKPSSSIIYYLGAANKANAERIGEVLGISNLSEVSDLRAQVSVVLR